MIQDFQHVCITCRDLERSIHFYERLGLEVIEPVSELNEDVIARAFQTPRGHVKVLHMAPPGAPSKMFIDLVQWLDPASTGDAYPAANHVGINHLAFRVCDIDGQRRLCGSVVSPFSPRNHNPSDLFEPFSPAILMECSFNSSNGRRFHNPLSSIPLPATHVSELLWNDALRKVGANDYVDREIRRTVYVRVAKRGLV